MSTSPLFVPLGDADTLAQKLLAVGNSLKPIDDANYYFFEIVRELVDAAVKNFHELRRGFVTGIHVSHLSTKKHEIPVCALESALFA